MSMNLEDIWSIAKEVILPLMGVIWYFFNEKIKSLEDSSEELEEITRQLDKKLSHVEATYATKAELAQLLNQINATLAQNNVSLENKIERIIDLKNETIRVMLEDVSKSIKKG